MIKAIFTKLLKNNQKFNQKEEDYLKSFIQNDIVVIENNEFTLNSKYRVGVLKIESKIAILEDLINEHKNIKLDFASLNGAYNNDLVLIKRVFNPKEYINEILLSIRNIIKKTNN